MILNYQDRVGEFEAKLVPKYKQNRFDDMLKGFGKLSSINWKMINVSILKIMITNLKH